MYRLLRNLWTTALLSCLVLLAAPPARAGSVAATVAALHGHVEYQHGGGPYLPLGWHAALYPGDIVRTGPDGQAELIFSDGASVKVDSRSAMRIPLDVIRPAAEKQTLFQIILGVVWAHLQPETQVEFPGHTNAVTHGTEILADVAADGTTTLTVLEGNVSFSNPLGTRELSDNEQSIAQPGKAPTPPVAVDPSGLIAWTADVAALPLEFELPALTPGSNGPPDFTAEATRLETQVQTIPNDAAAWVSLGQARRGLGDLTGALAAFAQAETLSPENTDARVGMALTYLTQGRPALARAALDPVQGRPMAQAVLGLVDLHEGKAEDAEQTLQAALAQSPTLYQARALLALAFLSRDDLPDATKSARQAVADDPNSAQAQGTLSLALFFAGQPGEAEKASRRAVQLNPQSPFALLTEGRSLLAQQQTDAARTAYEKAAAIAPHLPLVHQELGAVYQKLDMPRKATEEYSVALRLDPNSADAHTGLGLADQSQGRYADAEREHLRALQLAPNNTTAIYNLAALYIDRGRLDEARRLLERGVRTDPIRGILYARLAEIFLYRQDLFTAQDYARRAVSLLPDSALTHYELGRVYLEQERTTQAEQEFREATILDRQFAAARYALGLTEQRTEAGLLNSFTFIPASALIGSPGAVPALNNLQTPGAEERIQAALLDPTVIRSASRSYGDTEIDGSFGERNTSDLSASFLNETADGRGVRGISGEEQHTNGIRPNADIKLDSASIVLGQKAATNSSGYLLLGDYQGTESGLDAGVTPDPFVLPFRFHTQLPRLIAGATIPSGEGRRLRVLFQGSTTEYAVHDTSQANDDNHTHYRSLDGELRWDAQLGTSNLFSAGLSYGTRRSQNEVTMPSGDPSSPPYEGTIITQEQPFQAYIRDEAKVNRYLSLTGQMQLLNIGTFTYERLPVQFDQPTDRKSHRTTLGLPALILDYQADPHNLVRLRAQRIAASVEDFQLLTPRDVFLLSFSGLPQTIVFDPIADATSVEVEYDHTFANASFLSAAAFQEDLRQARFTDIIAGPYNPARVQGVQASYQGLLGQDLSFFLNTQFNHAQDIRGHQRIPQVPDYLGLASLQYLNHQGFYAQATYYYQGNRIAADADPTRFGGFGLVNVRVGMRVGLRTNVFVELDNAFNRQYDVFGVLQSGRQVKAGISLRF